MSERARESSVSQAVQELSGRVKTWESKLEGWRKVISKTLLDVLEQSEAKAVQRSQSDAQGRARERLDWQQEMQSLLTRLTDAGDRHAALSEKMEALSGKMEAQHEPGFLGLSRDRWRVVLVSAVVSVVVGLGAVTLYQTVGPAARENARLIREIERWNELWAVTTPAGQAAIIERAKLKRANEKKQP